MLGLALAAVADHSVNHQVLVNVSRNGVAMDGYDPVAYFTQGKAIRGRSRWQVAHERANYCFASEEHRRLFGETPHRYVPAYGGFCGYAASVGKVRPVDPRFWSIVDGRLILQHSKRAVELWERDVSGNKARADRYWPRLVQKKAGVRNPIDRRSGKSVLGNLD